METEFEAKFYPVDKESFRKKLKKLGAKIFFPERKMKRVIFEKSVNPQLNCDYLRIRDEGDKITMSLKTHALQDGVLTDQKEVMVKVDNFDQAVQLIKEVGLVANRYQETLRETWHLNGAEITIDTWPGLDSYTEIEAGSEEKVKEIALFLGLDWERKIITSVVEIYMRIYGLDGDSVLKKISNITFENNPFKGLKRHD